jgi:hypothetical protein
MISVFFVESFHLAVHDFKTLPDAGGPAKIVPRTSLGDTVADVPRLRNSTARS